MEVSYYNLSGGINTSLTKTELGMDTKKICWSDAENVEIYMNRGITKQKGNKLYLELNDKEAITGIAEMTMNDSSKLLITTISGKIYVYDDKSLKLNLLEKVLEGKKPRFVNFLNGIVITSENDPLFYVKETSDKKIEIVDCGLKDFNEKIIKNAVVSVFRGRIFAAHNSTIYYSALGTYDDFTTENDAGYIKDFHTDTDAVTALQPYKDYLAIYKKNKVYLLSGVTSADFQIMPFADKGSYSANGIVNVDNKQYFLSNGIFALEQSGVLNQIQLGAEITSKIKSLFANLSEAFLANSFCIHYPKKSQVWYYFPTIGDEYFHTVWINDYLNKAWYKRVVPQDVTCAAKYKDSILCADKDGKIYVEDMGNTFDGAPIKFIWKSPFLTITQTNHRKTIDEFYFILDSEQDNDFYFTVYKDFDSGYSDDPEHIYSFNEEHFVWGNDDEEFKDNECWSTENSTSPIWSVNKDIIEKAEISESNYSVQLCVEGREIINSCAIIGLNFKEVYNDD